MIGAETMRKALLALTLAAFGIGTSEFIIMGLLPDLAHSFSISIPKAGVIVSAYALSVCIGSPFVALAVSRMERKRALILLMGVFVLGNLACALAPTFGFMIAARILTALCHGAFFGTGSIVASNLVPREKRAQAITMMFSGLMIANILGVPAGTALGHAFGWRYSFVALLPIGIAAMLGLLFLVPPQASEPVHFMHEVRTVLKLKVQLVLALSTLSSVSLFAVFTYIAPTLGTVTHLSPNGITWVLVIFGAGITVGNAIGGKLADWKQMATVIGGMIAVVLVLLVMPFAERSAVSAATIVFLWGCVHLIATAPYQARIVEKARRAPNLASTLNQGAFNMGNALGASLGGLVLTAGYSYRALPVVSAIVAVIVLVIAVIAMRIDKIQLSEPDFEPFDSDLIIRH
jgi:DHA1 family inner membrane transport protein